jgi:hypothetical protein
MGQPRFGQGCPCVGFCQGPGAFPVTARSPAPLPSVTSVRASKPGATARIHKFGLCFTLSRSSTSRPLAKNPRRPGGRPWCFLLEEERVRAPVVFFLAVGTWGSLPSGLGLGAGVWPPERLKTYHAQSADWRSPATVPILFSPPDAPRICPEEDETTAWMFPPFYGQTGPAPAGLFAVSRFLQPISPLQALIVFRLTIRYRRASMTPIV